VQTIGQLHQQHADVARHGEQELAQIVGGAFAFGLRLDLAELGDAIDQSRDILAEELADLFARGDCILDGNPARLPSRSSRRRGAARSGCQPPRSDG
jgi:hypothetical protein